MRVRLLLALLLAAGSVAALPQDDELPDETGTPLPMLSRAPLPTSPEAVDRLLEQVERDERAVKKQLEDLVRESERTHARAVTRGRAYVRMARAGLLTVSGGFESLVDHASRLERLRRAVQRDLDFERNIVRRRLALSKRWDELRTRRGPLEVQQQAMAEARTALLAVQDRRLSFERAFESNASSAHTAIYGSSAGPVDPSELAAGFSALKGRLTFPLPGRSEIRRSERADGPGLEMYAPRGTPVRAVYPGHVAFADSYADYGKTVIIDHGGRHYTVSASLEDISVQVGEDVSVGARVGSVGDAGRGALLYFEIRVGTESVDPAEWFGI